MKGQMPPLARGVGARALISTFSGIFALISLYDSFSSFLSICCLVFAWETKLTARWFLKRS